MSKRQFLLLVLFVGISACFALAFLSQSVVNKLLTETRIGYGWHVAAWLFFAVFCWFAYGANEMRKDIDAAWLLFERLGIPINYSLQSGGKAGSLATLRLRRLFVSLSRALVYYCSPEKESLEMLYGAFKIRPYDPARLPYKVIGLNLMVGNQSEVIAEVRLMNMISDKEQALSLVHDGKSVIYKLDGAVLFTQEIKDGKWIARIIEALNFAEYKELSAELGPLFENNSRNAPLPAHLQRLSAAVHKSLIRLIPVGILETACGANKVRVEKEILIEWKKVRSELTDPLRTLIAPTVMFICVFKVGRVSLSATILSDVFRCFNGDYLFCLHGKESGGSPVGLFDHIVGVNEASGYADMPGFFFTKAGELIQSPRTITPYIVLAVSGAKQFENDAAAARALETLKEQLNASGDHSVSATACDGEITAGLLKVIFMINASRALVKINEDSKEWRRNELAKIIANYYELAKKALT